MPSIAGIAPVVNKLNTCHKPSPAWASSGTRICSPDSYIGCEKSNFFKRSDVMEIADIPSSPSPASMADSNSFTLALALNLELRPISVVIAFHSSIEKPVQEPTSSMTNGGNTRVMTVKGLS